jgi:hypothetical protein
VSEWHFNTLIFVLICLCMWRVRRANAALLSLSLLALSVLSLVLAVRSFSVSTTSDSSPPEGSATPEEEKGCTEDQVARLRAAMFAVAGISGCAALAGSALTVTISRKREMIEVSSAQTLPACGVCWPLLALVGLLVAASLWVFSVESSDDCRASPAGTDAVVWVVSWYAIFVLVCCCCCCLQPTVDWIHEKRGDPPA